MQRSFICFPQSGQATQRLKSLKKLLFGNKSSVLHAGQCRRMNPCSKYHTRNVSSLQEWQGEWSEMRTGYVFQLSRSSGLNGKILMICSFRIEAARLIVTFTRIRSARSE